MSIKGEHQTQYKNANEFAQYPQTLHMSSIYNSHNNSFLEQSSKQISTSTSIKDINSLTNLNYPASNSSKNLYAQQGHQPSLMRNTKNFETERDDRISAEKSGKASRNASLTH